MCVDTTFSSFIVPNLLNKYFIDIFLKLIWLVFFIFRSFFVILKGFSNRVLCIDKKNLFTNQFDFCSIFGKISKKKVVARDLLIGKTNTFIPKRFIVIQMI